MGLPDLFQFSFELQMPLKQWCNKKTYCQQRIKYLSRKKYLSNIQAKNHGNNYTNSHDYHIHNKRVFQPIQYCHSLFSPTAMRFSGIHPLVTLVRNRGCVWAILCPNRATVNCWSLISAPDHSNWQRGRKGCDLSRYCCPCGLRSK